jgi:hypothetical protein
MPPLMVGVWDSQTRLSIAQARAPDGPRSRPRWTCSKACRSRVAWSPPTPCTPIRPCQGGAQGRRPLRLGFKADRPKLLADVQAAFDAAGDSLPVHQTLETRHGRRELRAASVLPAAKLAADPGWTDLVAIGCIQAERTKDGRTAASARYILLSRKLSPAKLAQVVRAHRKSPALDPGRGLR